jgi:DnaJ-class molecular chaperone
MPSNLPNGTLAADISANECPACEGAGEVETILHDRETGEMTEAIMTCPRCSGLGVINTRVR